MKVNLDTLAIGKSTEVVEEYFLRFPDEADSDKLLVSGDVTLDNTAAGVLISGRVNVSTDTDCSNCLEPFELIYIADVEIFIDRVATQVDVSESDWVICQQRGVVDISESLRDVAMLSRPQRIVCDEECNGFCVQCGKNLNEQSCDCKTEETDSRWDALP
ncbi:MAG: DUF177 domain-containing protein [bacterium]|nr:DUF177 domain-containing protein [bacterium]MCP4799824.1 DUF177 domain-containing protein [bacterium]